MRVWTDGVRRRTAMMCAEVVKVALTVAKTQVLVAMEITRSINTRTKSAWILMMVIRAHTIVMAQATVIKIDVKALACGFQTSPWHVCIGPRVSRRLARVPMVHGPYSHCHMSPEASVSLVVRNENDTSTKHPHYAT